MSAKNLIDSKTTEKIIAIVVNIAMTELTASIYITIFSTAFRERKLPLIFL